MSENGDAMVVPLHRLNRLLELAGEVIIISSNLDVLNRRVSDEISVSDAVTEDTKELSLVSTRIASDLHELVTDIRNVHMSTFIARFQRIARDCARREGKTVQFDVVGADLSLDKTVADIIYDPIAHQIRNAIAHGIETPEARIAAGKDPVGKVRLTLSNDERNTTICIVDDGRGISRDKVVAQAVKMGLLTTQRARLLSDQAVYEFIFAAGFSTSKTSTATSGRGVGMDVIRSAMVELGGETRIESAVGKGSTITLSIPQISAVNITDSLVVRCNEVYLAFPLSVVVQTLAIEPSAVTQLANGSEVLRHQESMLPLQDALTVLKSGPVRQSGQHMVLIIEYRGQRLALKVSEFLSPQKLVISEFNNTVQIDGLLGTTVLGGRLLGLIVDVPRYIGRASGQPVLTDTDSVLEAASHSPAPDRPPKQAAAPKPTPTSNREPVNLQDDLGAEFLVEVQAMLAELNKSLLALDEDRAKEHVDVVFRLAHSIKGNLSMYGALEAAELMHRLETQLVTARSSGHPISDQALDVLFDGTTYFDEFVQCLVSKRAIPKVPEPLLSALGKLENAAVAVQEDTGEMHFGSLGRFLLSARRRQQQPLVHLSMQFSPGDQPAFLLSYLVLVRMQRFADILGTSPSLGAIEKGTCDGRLEVVMSPKRDVDMNELHGLLRDHYCVVDFEHKAWS